MTETSSSDIMNFETFFASSNLPTPIPSSPPSEEMVQEFETEIGAALPSDYRMFLLRYGGCEMEFEAPVIEPCPWGAAFTQTQFHTLSLNREPPCNLRFFLSSQITPRNMIVIASGDLGQATALSFAGVDKGSVFFLDEYQMAFADESHNYYSSCASVREYVRLRDADELKVKPPGYDHCYESAPSFAEFLAILKPLQDEEEE